MRAIALVLALLPSIAFGITEDELRDALAQTEPGIYGPVGPVVELPVGRIVLTEPLVIDNRAHCEMIGRGSLATEFHCRGLSNKPAIILQHGLQCLLQGFSITGEFGVGVSIRTSENPPAWPISSSNMCRDIAVHKGAKAGFYIDSRRDQNNEFHRFEWCSVSGADAGYRIRGTQAHRIQFDNCVATRCKRGVFGERGNYWSWTNGQATGNVVDFTVGTFGMQVVIDGHRSEGSERLIGGAPEWSLMPLALKNITWDGRPPDNGAPVVSIQRNGPIRIENVILTSKNGNPINLRIFDHDYGALSVDGLVFDYWNTDAPETGVSIPEWFDVSERGVYERVGGGRERAFKLRP